LTQIHEIWYGRYATGDFSKPVLCNFLHLVIPMWQLLDVVKWNYDDSILYACVVIAYDPLRMRITNLT
jgi:hypothetical protein